MKYATRRTGLSVSAMVLGLVVAAGEARAGMELVVNGGFETGDFSGWTLGGNTLFASVTSSTSHSGTFSAQFGEPGSDGNLSQTQNLQTTAGHTYHFSFWLENDPTPSPANDFSAIWNGATVFSKTNAQPFDWTEESFDLTATSSSTPLEFVFRNDPVFWHLDEVSVMDNAQTVVPEPATAAYCVVAGLVGVAGYAWRRRKTRLAHCRVAAVTETARPGCSPHPAAVG